MISIRHLTDSTPLIGQWDALRARWEEDGTLFFRGIIDPELMKWAEQHFRQALADEELIDLDNPLPVWTGKKSDTWRPCDAIGKAVWPRIAKLPVLNDILRELFEAEPAWLPIVAHRSSFPSGPLKEGEDVFAALHQDGFYNEGMRSTICWLPIRDVKDMNSGTFALAPGTHKRGFLHDKHHPSFKIPEGSVQEHEWRSAEYRVGDVVIFRDDTVHAALPNLSDEFRMSIDLRAGSSLAPQPVIGTVERVDGREVQIRSDETGEIVTVKVDEKTFLRNMNPHPPIPFSEMERIAYEGSRVLAMADTSGRASVLRPNRY